MYKFTHLSYWQIVHLVTGKAQSRQLHFLHPFPTRLCKVFLIRYITYVFIIHIYGLLIYFTHHKFYRVIPEKATCSPAMSAKFSFCVRFPSTCGNSFFSTSLKGKPFPNQMDYVKSTWKYMLTFEWWKGIIFLNMSKYCFATHELFSFRNPRCSVCMPLWFNFPSASKSLPNDNYQLSNSQFEYNLLQIILWIILLC